MKTRNRLFLFCLCALLLAARAAQAAGVLPDASAQHTAATVYARTQQFRDSSRFTDRFHIATAGDYRVVLTDYGHPQPLDGAAFHIGAAGARIGTLQGPGSLSFSATPGDYFVSLFAVAAPLEVGKAQRFRRPGTDDEPGVRARRFSADGWHDEGGKWWGAARPGAARSAFGLGQYGIEVTQLPVQAADLVVIPVPAAIWLFVSGLATLMLGAVRRRA